MIYYIEVYKDYLEHFQNKRKNSAKTERRKESSLNKVDDLLTSNSINKVDARPTVEITTANTITTKAYSGYQKFLSNKVSFDNGEHHLSSKKNLKLNYDVEVVVYI